MLLHFCDNTFSIVDSDMTEKHTELMFPWQLWLCECTAILCYMYIAYLVLFFRTMAFITSLLVREAEIPFKRSPFLYVASMAIGTVSNEVPPTFYNRNPRNLERLRIAYKPSGYHLEAPGREFWHKYVYRKSV